MRSAPLFLTLALAGCATVTTADDGRLRLTSPEFRAYVERVFREQNRVADELAFALEDRAPPAAALSAAEQDLLADCAQVNELATANRDGQRLGWRRSLAAARSVTDCEQATRAAARALASL